MNPKQKQHKVSKVFFITFNYMGHRGNSLTENMATFWLVTREDKSEKVQYRTAVLSYPYQLVQKPVSRAEVNTIFIFETVKSSNRTPVYSLRHIFIKTNNNI